MRRLLHLPRWTFRVLVALVVAAALLFVVLTRTEVGREGVRIGLESAFERQFNGTLHLGHLSGDLVGTVHASDVVVRGPDGVVLVEADSLVLRPTFRGLLTRRFTLREAVLVRPHVYLRRDSTGWNITRLLRQQSEPSQWQFTNPRLRLIDGSAEVVVSGPVPGLVARGYVADVRHLRADRLDATLRLELVGGRRQVEVDALRARLRNPDARLSATGIWTLDGDRHLVDELDFQLDESRIAGHFGWAPDGPQPFEIDARLDLAGLRRYAPGLPAGATVRLRAEGEARPGEAHLTTVRIQRGNSDVRFHGDLTWADGTVSLASGAVEGRLSQPDLVALWPRAPEIARTLSRQARFEADGSGVFRRDAPSSASVRFSYAGEVGRMAGDVRAEGQRRWQVGGTLTAQRFVPASMFPELGDTELSGTLRGALTGASLATLSGQTTVQLADSRLAGRRVDSLSAHVRLDGTTFELSGRAAQGAARWAVAAQGNRDRTRLTARLDAARARLGALVPEASVEAFFTGSSSLSFSQAAGGRTAGSIAVSLDTLILARDSLRSAFDGVAFEALLDAAGAFSAELDADAVHVSASGRMPGTDPGSLLTGWAGVARQAAARLRPAERSAGLQPTMVSVEPARQEPFDLSVTMDVRDADRLRPLHPILGRLGPSIVVASMHADTSVLSLTARGVLAAPALTRVPSDSLRFEAGVSLSAAARIGGHVKLAADTLRLGPIVLPGTDVAVSLSNRSGLIRVHSRDAGRDVMRLSARLDARPSVTRIVVDTLQLTAGPYRLGARQPQRLDAYADGIVLPDFTLRTADEQGGITLSGILSPAATDTLYVDADDLPLAPVTARMGPRWRFDGQVNADVALTGVFAQPELTGHLDALALTWGRHVVGDVRLNSFYRPGTPDVALALSVRPTSNSVAGLQPTQNHVDVGGTFRLPSRSDPGILDLDVSADSADAFFFDHLFPTLIAGAEGRIVGSGHIGGSLRQPLFEADMRIERARFRIPRFNLGYTATARAQVDARGIHVSDGWLRDADGGTALLTGSVLFNSYRFFSLDVRGQLDRLLFLNVVQSPDLAFYGKMRGSGDVRLTGPLSAARLVSANAVLSEDSEVFIPIRASAGDTDPGFIIFADSTGRLPDLRRFTQRTSVIGQVVGERSFTAGLEMDLNLRAPPGVTVNLITDPLAGDVMRAVGSGSVQLQRRDGDFHLFGGLDVAGGDYLFTAGDLFVRRFAINSGTLSWDGDPLDPRLDIQAQYATRASLAGTPYAGAESRFVPLLVRLSVQDRLSALSLGLRLEFDRSERGQPLNDLQEIEQFLNQPDRQAEYATSVLLTNSFLLTTSLTDPGSSETIATTGNRFAFASLSQLVATQLNRYLAAVLPGVDFNLGVQGERANELDLTYGIALRLLDERLIIRGAGLLRTENTEREPQGLEGEFVVEVRLSPAVSVEVFYRREEDVLQRIVTASTGAGLSYNTQFTSWGAFWRRLTGQRDPDARLAADRP